MGLFSKRKSNTAIGLLLRPDRVVEQIKLEVDPPVVKIDEDKDRHMTWVLHRPLRKLDTGSVRKTKDSYVMLRPDRLEPIAPSGFLAPKTSMSLLGRAFRKEHNKNSAHPPNDSTTNLLMFDMILVGLALVFGLMTLLMLMPKAMTALTDMVS
tara:strand:+ start:610 stop:1068 length:459 start_codon:yes stop_codon:yes gene_type:complete